MENVKMINPKYGIKLLILAVTISHLTDASSLRNTRRGHRKSRRNMSEEVMINDKVPGYWKVRNHDETFFPILGNHTENVALTHVAFSVGKPTLPPSFQDMTTKSIPVATEHLKISQKRLKKGKSNHNKKDRRQRKRRHGHGLSEIGRKRRRRSHGGNHVRYGSPMSACTSMSDWVQISESVNMWGHRVTVLPYIEVGGRRIDQYIYETVCVDAGSPCLGTDRRHFQSECVTKKIFSYAFIRNEAGEEDWSLIEINGSCNCKIQRKHRTGQRSLLDHLSNTNGS
ncbi:nerve growth factor-like [Argopecten irradians]|uniref:nerve growth factor-like n=1 Tax=Argopecten irradians TaxID=31199 RepID=UPI00371B901A